MPARPLHRLLQTTSPPWVSRPPPGHFSRIQCRPFRVGDSKKVRYSNINNAYFSTDAGRAALWHSWPFPRKMPPIRSRIWWSLKHTPPLLRAIVLCGIRYVGRLKNPQSPEEKGAVVKSGIGLFFYSFVSQPEVFRPLKRVVAPWGEVWRITGASMKPTFGANDAIMYLSYAYRNSQDVSLGDVVLASRRKSGHVREINCCKRVAALGEGRILDTRKRSIIRIERNHCFLLGDNSSVSQDSRSWGPVPITAVEGKVQWRWGSDGFEWPNHGRRPWLKNKTIEYLAPGQNRPTQQPQKKPEPIMTPKISLPVRPPPRKRERKDPRKKV